MRKSTKPQSAAARPDGRISEPGISPVSGCHRPARSLFVALISAVLVLLTSTPAQAAGYRLYQTKMPDGSTQVARWDPCDSVTYQVSLRGVKGERDKRRTVRMARATVARLESVSGLNFVFAGRTGTIPRRDGLSRQSVDVLIGFVRPGQTDYPLAGRVAGYGGYRAGYIRDAQDQWRVKIDKAFVAIDQPQTRRWPNRLDRRGVTRPNLLTHELGHAVGLGHVDDRRQIMHSSIHARSPAGYARGDRQGLNRVGAAAGCIS